MANSSSNSTNRKIVNLFIILWLMFAGYFAGKELYFLARYPIHQGFTHEAFGSWVSLRLSLFYVIYWLMTFLGLLLLLLTKRSGWVLVQIVLWPAMAILLFAIILSLFTPADYFKIQYILLLIAGAVFIVILNRRSFLSQFQVDRTIKSYAPIVIGIGVLLLFAMFGFAILMPES